MSYLDENFKRFIGLRITVSEERLEEMCEDWFGEEDENGIISGEGNIVFDSHPYNEDNDDEDKDEDDEDDWDESDEWEVSASLRFEIEAGRLVSVEPEVSIYGDPGLGEEDPEDTWNNEDESAALEFLSLIIGGDGGDNDECSDDLDEGVAVSGIHSRKEDLIELLATCLNNATINTFTEQLADECVYTSSGSLRSKGKNAVSGVC